MFKFRRVFRKVQGRVVMGRSDILQIEAVISKISKVLRSHPLSTYAKFLEKLTFLTVRVRIRGLEILVFLKILCTYLMDDLYVHAK